MNLARKILKVMIFILHKKNMQFNKNLKHLKNFEMKNLQKF